jgi:hypothetical protein
MRNLLKLILLGFCVFGSLKPSWAEESPEASFIIPIPPYRSLEEASNPLSNMTRDTLLYMMSLFLNPTQGTLRIIDSASTDSREWVLVPISAVHPASVTSFRKASGEVSPFKVFQIFKDLLKTQAYFKVRAWHHSRFIIPATLDELEHLYSFHSWKRELIENSLIKGTRRVIYRSPKPWPYISIAQTETSPNQTIRETEIIIPREDLSGQYDFYAYDGEGKLTRTSSFHTSHGKDITAPVPFTCLACHYNGAQGVFHRSPDSFHSHVRN